MEEFDFNNPINVTIIFDEIEEGTIEVKQEICDHDSKDVTKNSELFVKDDNLNKTRNRTIIESIDYNKPKYCIEITSSKTDTHKTLSESCPEILSNNDDSNRVLSLNVDLDISNKSVTENTNKIVISLQSNRPNEHTTQSKNKIQSSITEQKEKYDQNLNTQNINNVPISNKTHNHNVQGEALEDNFELKSKDESHVSKLLNNLSQNLVNILELHHLEKCQQMLLLGENERKASNDTFKRIKNHHFKLSYRLIIDVILPNASNEIFVDAFLYDTLKRANSTEKKYRFADIVPLWRELLEWAQRVHNQLHNPISSNPFPNTNDNSGNQPNILPPVLVTRTYTSGHFGQGLPSAPMRELKQRPKTCGNNKINQTLRTSPVSSKQRSKGSKNVDTSVLNSQKQQVSPHFHPSNYINMSNQAHVLQKNHLFHNVNQRSHVQTQYYRHENPMLPRPQQCTSWQSNYPPNMFLSPNLNATPRWPVLQDHPLNNMQRFAMNEHLSYKHNTAAQNHIMQPQIMNQMKSIRSSACTNSGFIRPQNYYNRMGKECSSMGGPGLIRLSSIPQQSPVTSLNPNTMLKAVGACCVCKITTETMCSGCCKYYYCSNKCQISDWKNHQKLCFDSLHY